MRQEECNYEIDDSGELRHQQATEIREYSEKILALATADVDGEGIVEAKGQQQQDDGEEVAKKMLVVKDKAEDEKNSASSKVADVTKKESSPSFIIPTQQRSSKKKISETTTSSQNDDESMANFVSREQQQQHHQQQPGAYHRVPGGESLQQWVGDEVDNNNTSSATAMEDCVGMGIPVVSTETQQQQQTMEESHHHHQQQETTTFEVLAVKVEPEEEERRVREQILSEAVQADAVVIEMENNNDNCDKSPQQQDLMTTTHRGRRRKRYYRMIALGVIVLLIILTLVGVVVGLAISKSSDNFTSNHQSTTTTTTTNTATPNNDQTIIEDPTMLLPPSNNTSSSTIDNDEKEASSTTRPTTQLLETIIKADNLRCGVPHVEHFLEYDFEIDLCRAMAAAVLGDPNKVEIIDLLMVDRFVALANKTVDLYARVAYTMERDIHEKHTASGFSFTEPYYYGGLVFGGMPDVVKCADALQTWGNCSDLKVCVAEGTSHQDIIEVMLPKSHILAIPTAAIAPAMVQGNCNAVLGFSYDLSKALVVQQALGPGYVVGERVLHYEGLSIATRDDDPQWSDVVNSVLLALMVAEEEGITSSTAEDFPTTSVFGGNNGLEKLFQRAIGAVGNYQELYTKYYEDIVPRHNYGGINEINTYPNPSSGVIRAPNLGTISRSGPAPIPGGILERIIQRDQLICGISGRQAGFAEYDAETDEWSGLDIDYCRALSASLFFGRVDDALVFFELTHPEDGFLALADGTVDVVCGVSVDLTKEVREKGSGEGFSFSQPYYYENTRPGETRALVTQQEDPQWASFSYWVVASTFYAEANNITQFSSNKMDEVGLFGPDYRRMFRDTILAVGNYGDLYSRNLESIIPRDGLNLLNVGGPMMRPYPF